MQVTSASLGGGYAGAGVERAHVTDHLIGSGQKIPDWPIRNTLLGKVETAIRAEIKSRSGTLGFSTSDAILGLWFPL